MRLTENTNEMGIQKLYIVDVRQIARRETNGNRPHVAYAGLQWGNCGWAKRQTLTEAKDQNPAQKCSPTLGLELENTYALQGSIF